MGVGRLAAAVVLAGGLALPACKPPPRRAQPACRPTWTRGMATPPPASACCTPWQDTRCATPCCWAATSTRTTSAACTPTQTAPTRPSSPASSAAPPSARARAPHKTRWTPWCATTPTCYWPAATCAAMAWPTSRLSSGPPPCVCSTTPCAPTAAPARSPAHRRAGRPVPCAVGLGPIRARRCRGWSGR